MKEYDFIRLELENGDIVFVNLMKIVLCLVRENIVKITLFDGSEYVLNKNVCSELLEELNFWSVNDEQMANL